MTSSPCFSLNGLGYLENITFRECKSVATIKAVNVSSQDELYLECEVQGELEAYLYALLTDVKKGHAVLISFSAVYRKFRVAFSVQDSEAENHDKHIVTLGCKLLNMDSCYINGASVDRSNFRYLLAA